MAPDGVMGVVGAGAMGAGIAQLAALAGHSVVLADARADALDRARSGFRSAIARLVEKGRLSSDDADAAMRRIRFAEPDSRGQTDTHALRECALVIEAIIEDPLAKSELFARVEQVVAPQALIATNTSSLSIAGLSASCEHPERFVGLHFFNPAPVMALVEVIPGVRTNPEVAPTLCALMRAWGKVPVVAADTPGFIVNRVARPFYGEALRLLEEGVADPATIDHAMKSLGGFRMGPCELMDFIGHDVNFAVTRSVYEQMFHEPRFRPSLRQQRLVEAGLLGRKSGHGFYAYGPTAAPAPAPSADAALLTHIFERIMAMLVNEACEAVFAGVASADDVELAMTKGVNYPKGLLAWGDALGPAHLLQLLQGLQAELGSERYRPSAYLSRRVRDGRGLLG